MVQDIITESTNMDTLLMEREKSLPLDIKIKETTPESSGGVLDLSKIDLLPKLWEWRINISQEEKKETVLPERLTNPKYGSAELNQTLRKMAESAPGIEKIWEMTKDLPSLTDILLEEREQND